MYNESSQSSTMKCTDSNQVTQKYNLNQVKVVQ